MIKEIIATGKDVVEAKENAREALGAGPLDDVQFEVLHAGSRGIFGLFGVKPAQVKAFIEIPDRENKPKFERKKPESKVENENQENGEAKAEVENKPYKKKRTKKPTRVQEVEKAERTAPSKPKSQVIPEAELKMEPKIVAEGEDMSFDFINTVIRDTGLNATAELFSCEDGTRRITIKGEDAHTLIGHHGDTLDSLQYLANLASAKKNINGERDKSRVTLDIESYRAKREETLRALARRMAAKALKNHRSVMLEPMSAYERRIIHSEIQNIEGVSTNSVGSDNNRKIVIFLTDKKPKGIFEEDVENDNAAVDVVEETTETVAEETVEEVVEESHTVIDEEQEIK